MSLALNALFRKYMGIQANLDSQEFQINQAAETNRIAGERQLKDSEKNLSAAMSSKGMSHSGVNLEQNVNLKKAYGEQTARAEQETQRLLTDIAKKRLEAESEYQSAKAYDPIQQIQATLG